MFVLKRESFMFRSYIAHILSIALIAGTYATNVQAHNTYLKNITAFLAMQDAPLQQHQPSDAYDKIFMEVFREAKPETSPLIRLTAEQCPALYQFIKNTSVELDISMPRLFFSNDEENVDIKCATFNEESALLFHGLTFTSKNTRAFRGYLRTALHTVARTVEQHRKLLMKQQNWQIGSWLGSALALGGLLLIGSHTSLGTGNKAPWLKGATVLAGIGCGAWIRHIMGQRITTISYQRVPSFDNREEAREDLFPGATPDEILIPVYNGSQHLATELVLKAQAYVKKRNEDFLEQQEYDRQQALLDEAEANQEVQDNE